MGRGVPLYTGENLKVRKWGGNGVFVVIGGRKLVLRNIFRHNNDEELSRVVRKTERDNETYKFVCFLA